MQDIALATGIEGYVSMTDRKLIWPNFFIVGAVKSGTTSLYAQLKKHPQVFLPEMKEPHYFASSPQPPNLEDQHCTGDLEAYQRLYRGAESFPAIGDASPSYLWDEKAPRNIYEVCPQAKIIIILRDPVARAYSEYHMAIMNGSETLPFPEALRLDYAREKKGYWIARLLVELGMYHDQVLRYFDTFGRDRVLVLLFEDLIKNPKDLYARIATHLGIDPGAFDASEYTDAQNAYKMPRSLIVYHLWTSPASRALRRKLLPPSVQKRIRNSSILQLFFDNKKPEIDDESRRFLQAVFEPEVTALKLFLDGRCRSSENPGLNNSLEGTESQAVS